ncbi:hypothetical protein HY68_01235 [Streptomyces sp. AcH 505]|uniref:hypothetical protein n=1 Tax=Streptomyces sp. AcH 505 TaxID=352211 RepID=UPI000591E629|nr:hypothetical protein HY68_01235 [Streptomyces sp. AcH 505]
MGNLSQLLVDHLRQRDLSARQGAERSGMHFESFRKILAGLTERPRDATLLKISNGLSIPMARLIEARAKDANEPYEGSGPYEVQDITTTGALEIAIARVAEVSDEDLPEVRRHLEELMRAVQDAEAGRVQTAKAAEKDRQGKRE